MINNETKSRIIELRYKGQSYGVIANELKLSKETIRNICRREKLTDNELSSLSECLNCGTKIEQPDKGSRKVFCCEKCRSAWRRSTLRLSETKYDHICAECGKRFTTIGNKTQRFCSKDCYQNHRWGEVS